MKLKPATLCSFTALHPWAGPAFAFASLARAVARRDQPNSVWANTAA